MRWLVWGAGWGRQVMSNDTISFWVSASGSPTGDGSQQNPFSSIEQAQARVQAELASPGPLTKDIVVNIGDGTYQLANTLTFGAADSGRDGHTVHYRAADGAHPVISGGEAVTGWTPVAHPGITLAPGAQLWQAQVGTGIDSRQLYIDDTRATLAESNNADTSYPVGFHPSYYEQPGVSGIKYDTSITLNPQSPDSPNWADPTSWGSVGNVSDIQAVIYSQWKMISVPVSQVDAPSPGSTTGLIEMTDPAWTNANLIRNAPFAATTTASNVITMVDNGTTDHLAQVDTYFGNITVGMTVRGSGIPTDRTVTVTALDPLTHKVTLSDAAVATTPTGQGVALTFTDPLTHDVVTTNPNEWSFWRVSKFVNGYEFLDQPNEWYLDRTTGTLYLVTQAGDNPNNHDIQLPVLEKLIDGNGASNLSFEGLQFKYATWLDPNGPDGYVDDQSAFHITGSGHEANLIGHFQDVTRTPGNISFNDAVNINFEGNSFSHLGGVGLDLSGGAQDNRVAYNIFNDISSSAVVLGGVSDADARPATPAGVVDNNQIIGNYLSHIADEFYDAAGIFLGYSRNATISGNFITDTSWAGIAVGWGWGLKDEGGFPGLSGGTPDMWGVNTTPTIMEGNQITDNTITR
ncbi:MAG TPA: right-handed parallel beta-helix repeat-containing protein, partial [Vicinamibacterales bacterium]|nr:right-handed parallel beta-helix repeat-containing protein [Vicinamibacterales bacterium]